MHWHFSIENILFYTVAVFVARYFILLGAAYLQRHVPALSSPAQAVGGLFH